MALQATGGRVETGVRAHPNGTVRRAGRRAPLRWWAGSASVRPFPDLSSRRRAPRGAGPAPQTRRGAQRVRPPRQRRSLRGQRDDDVPDAGAVTDEAVAAYRLSVQAGIRCRTPARPDVRTHIRRWARARMADARLAGHRGHGLTAGPGAILASEPGAMTRRLTDVRTYSYDIGTRCEGQATLCRRI